MTCGDEHGIGSASVSDLPATAGQDGYAAKVAKDYQERDHMPIAVSGGTTVNLAGFRILSASTQAVCQAMYEACERRGKLRLFFANTNFIVHCRQLIPRIEAAPVCIVNDGIGLELAARMIHRRGFAENLNGSDFFPRFCQESTRPLRFFLFGSRPGIAEQAAQALVERFGQQVVGTCDGYGEFAALGPELVTRINDSGAEVVLVAFGNPLQEQWILDNSDAIDAPVMMGVGALLDFLSGTATRAPPWVRKLKMEWLYRLSREPRRLLKRYSVDLLVFFWICLRAGAGRPAPAR